MLEPGEHVRGSFAVAARFSFYFVVILLGLCCTLLWSRFLNTGYLWDTVRVMGGAYGASGSFSAVSGRYLFSSYRDPNVTNTLRAYDKAAQSIRVESEVLSEADVLEAVIGAIGDLDSPQSPDQKGFAALSQFLHGGTQADRQLWRDEVLATTALDFSDFGKRLSKLGESGSVVVVGSESSLEAANKDLDDSQKLFLEQSFTSVPAKENSD